MERVNFLEPGSGELALRRRPLVDADTDEDLAEERENARYIVKAGDKGGLAVGLGEVSRGGDAKGSVVSIKFNVRKWSPA
jgi:hypothetical protein